MTRSRADIARGLGIAALVTGAVFALLHPATAARLYFADPAPAEVVGMVEALRDQGPLVGLSADKRWVPVPAGAEVQPGPCLRQSLSRGGRGQPQAVGVIFTCAATLLHPAEGLVQVVVERTDWRSWLGGAPDPSFRPGLRVLPDREARAALARMGRE